MIKDMPKAIDKRLQGVTFELPQKALAHWDAGICAAEKTDNTISILDPIGFDPWTGDGVTAKRISAALRSIGKRDVVVNINSPGGDLFEGMAIYNMLREHEGNVTVKVLGLAASAASIIAMAADEVQVARAGFLMIHNTWVIAIGNRNDLRDMADQLEPFDKAMADIYSARTGEDKDHIRDLMDAETWFGGEDAVNMGFADSLLPSDETAHDAKAGLNAARKLDVALARAGMPRSERRKLIKEIKSGKQDAAEDTPSAVYDGEILSISHSLTEIFK